MLTHTWFHGLRAGLTWLHDEKIVSRNPKEERCKEAEKFNLDKQSEALQQNVHHESLNFDFPYTASESLLVQDPLGQCTVDFDLDSQQGPLEFGRPSVTIPLAKKYATTSPSKDGYFGRQNRAFAIVIVNP